MRFITAFLALSLLVSPAFSLASESPAVSARAANVELLLDRAMSQNLIAGGVVVIGNRDGIIATAARGQLSDSPSAPAINEHTIFDVASLTKVIATAPAVMKLVDEGKVSVSDPVSRYLPEFAGHDEITIFHLLTHTSGLDDVSASGGIRTLIRKASAERNRPRPGSRFQYADINFILLGEVVHRASGETLDNFCKNEIYADLGANDTMFLPPRDLASSIAPTSGLLGGTVQDPNARHLGGVAGHAGLFSSAYDLSLFARMILGGGELQDKRVISEQTLSRMTTPYYCSNGSVKRGLGWDMQSPFSAPKGSYFSAASFGHTGYSGSSIWIDPQQDLFVVMLTRRVNYRDTRSFNNLRRDVSTMASADFRPPGEERETAPSIDVATVSPREAAPSIEVASLNTQVMEAALPAIKASSRITRLSASGPSRWQHKQRVQRHSRRVVAKNSARHGGHVRVAKAEGKALHKKKRSYIKS